MIVPPAFQAEVASLPSPLRAVLEAELAAGNEILDVVHTFPAPPIGACVRLARPLSPDGSSVPAGVNPCRFPNWDGSSGLSDMAGHYFVLGPPVAPPDPPGMDEIGAGRSSGATPIAQDSGAGGRGLSDASVDSPLGRFERSMAIDYEKWHDGIGYDLDAIREASPDERKAIETLLVERGARDWRDVEALTVLNTAGTRALLERAKRSPDHEVALAVARYAPDVLSDDERTTSIVTALRSARFYGGLSEALDLAEVYHPRAVLDALVRATIEREGEVAVHCAALLMFLHGKADGPFDMAQRPFFLTFNTSDRRKRAEAFHELCVKIGLDPNSFVG